MIFDEERKGPSEFATRGIVFSLLRGLLNTFPHFKCRWTNDCDGIVTYLSDATKENLSVRATAILSYLRDRGRPDDLQPLSFIQSMHTLRPYKMLCKEIVSVTKEVFWIFLHQTNVIPVIQLDHRGSSSYPTVDSHSTIQLYETNQFHHPSSADWPKDSRSSSSSSTDDYSKIYFPRERPPVPAAPYVGGVEWEATNYISTHLDLLNALIASLPNLSARNAVRTDLRLSGFEKVMGVSLRTCKEKFYGSVHDGLKTWVSAASADGWNTVDHIRFGPPPPGTCDNDDEGVGGEERGEEMRWWQGRVRKSRVPTRR